jgi:hypothetical protein
MDALAGRVPEGKLFARAHLELRWRRDCAGIAGAYVGEAAVLESGQRGSRRSVRGSDFELPHVDAQRGLEVTSYEDDAIGVMTKNERGIPWVSSVALRPRVMFNGPRPAPEVEADLHHKAHEGCYIANSVKTDIRVTPTF